MVRLALVEGSPAVSLIGLAGKAMTPKLVIGLAGALLVVAPLAGWSLWRLAGAGARCDTRIVEAKARGSAAVRALVASQESSLALIKANDDARLLALQAAIPARQVERVTVYRDRVRTVEVPECRVTPEQVQAINEVLR